MFPIRDHNPSNKFPAVTLGIILLTSLVFVIQIVSPDPDAFIFSYALIPSLVEWTSPTSLLPFIYSMFLHGGWLHIISNMWFLWIFGDNIEASLGSILFFIFYIVSGVAAGGLQYALNPHSSIPTLGASGAIAGVLGAYIILFPNHKIDTIIPTFGGFINRVQLPASLMLGYWFVIQLFSGVGSFSLGGESGGVAWWAHIGGFIAGIILTKMLPKKK